jgi:hypothetical protein
MVNPARHECKRERWIARTGWVLLSRTRLVFADAKWSGRAETPVKRYRSACVQVDVITQHFDFLLDERQLRPAN